MQNIFKKVLQKHITVITGFYFPEDTAIGLYTKQLVDDLIKNNYTVEIITGFPNYPKWKIFEDYQKLNSFYQEDINKTTIYRYKQFVPKKVNLSGRLTMIFSLLYGTFVNVKKIKNTDLVICIIPFTFLIFPASVLAKKHQAKLWVHVQDFEFDLALESGVIGKKNLFFNWFKTAVLKLEKKLLNKATVLSSISKSMMNKGKFKTNRDFVYFPNWVSSTNINPHSYNPHSFFNPNKFSLLYSGNIGEKQDWNLFENLCKIIKKEDNIEINIVGNGSYYENLKKIISNYDFVKLHEPVPYKRLNDLLCSANLHFLFQKTEVVDTVMPSKILGMMASKKPSIITGNLNSEVYNVIHESNGGFYFENNDIKLIYNKIIELKNNTDLCTSLGNNARKYILENFSESSILNNFQEELKSLLKSQKKPLSKKINRGYKKTKLIN